MSANLKAILFCKFQRSYYSRKTAAEIGRRFFRLNTCQLFYDEEDTEVSQIGKYEELLPCIGAMEATCKEYDRVVMRMDRGFYYDDSGYLRYNGIDSAGGQLYGRVRKLFHGLSRAKEKIALVVDSDPELFEAVLSMLQAEAR